MIRITGGILRGRTLRTLRGRHSRPTLSRVREAVFNILGQDLRGVRFVDLFSGVGTVGIEALSRGAIDVVFVDRDPRCIRTLSANLEALELKNRAHVVVDDAMGWLGRYGADGEVVFADPPYDSELATRVLELAGGSTKGVPRWVVIQHGPKHVLPTRAGVLCQVRSRSYGDTVVDFYQPAEEDKGEAQ